MRVIDHLNGDSSLQVPQRVDVVLIVAAGAALTTSELVEQEARHSYVEEARI